MRSLRLYGFWRSSSAWRVRLALALKGIEYDYVAVDLVGEGAQHRADFAAKSPLAQVPVIEVEDPGGASVRITQSVAIIEYLDEIVPEPRLLPGDPLRRARVRELVEMINAGIQPAQNLYLLNQLKAYGLEGKRSAWACHFIERGLRGLERAASETAGAFLAGDDVTAADVFLVPQLYNARRFGVDVAAFPTLLRAEASCEALDAFAAAHPDRQPDAPRTDD
jgi:maleylpyruvate isomerase